MKHTLGDEHECQGTSEKKKKKKDLSPSLYPVSPRLTFHLESAYSKCNEDQCILDP